MKRGKTPRRKVLNESEVINVLKEYHYDVIDCYELSIEEQIDIFSQSRNIIIPSGAAMANLIFVPDNINVVEIRSNLDGDYSNKINLQNSITCRIPFLQAILILKIRAARTLDHFQRPYVLRNRLFR